MLNPEYVDYDKRKKNMLNVGFADPEGDEVLSIPLGFDEAFRLGKMLIEQTTMIAKEKYNKSWDYTIEK